MSASKFDVDKVREMLEKATLWPWVEDERYTGKVYSDDDLGTIVADCGPFQHSFRTPKQSKRNANLIAAAPTLLSAACDRIERLERVADAASELLLQRLGYEHASIVGNFENMASLKRYEDIAANDLANNIAALDADDAEVE